MKSLISWLLAFFGIIFWAFRVVVAFTYSMKFEFIVQPLNMNVEIVLLFVTMVCLILIIKRKVIGAIIYAISYGAYFGVEVYNTVMAIINNTESVQIADATSLLISFIAIVLAVAILIDVIISKTKLAQTKNKKTDWFYENKQFDRQKDDRSDKNNYRIN